MSKKRDGRSDENSVSSARAAAVYWYTVRDVSVARRMKDVHDTHATS